MNIFSRWLRVWNKPAHGRISDNPITVVLTQYHVKNSYEAAFLEALRAYIAGCLRATGNVMAEAFYEQGAPSIMWVIERWSQETFYKKNRRSHAAKVVSALTKKGLASPVETTFIKDLEMLSQEAGAHRSTANSSSLTIMLFVEVKDGTEDSFRSMNRLVMSAFRNEPGVLLFRLSQVCYSTTRFVVYKRFRNQDAFQYHLKDPALGPIMRFLQTSVKNPPFEKGYHHLVQFAPL